MSTGGSSSTCRPRLIYVTKTFQNVQQGGSSRRSKHQIQRVHESWYAVLEEARCGGSVWCLLTEGHSKCHTPEPISELCGPLRLKLIQNSMDKISVFRLIVVTWGVFILIISVIWRSVHRQLYRGAYCKQPIRADSTWANNRLLLNYEWNS